MRPPIRLAQALECPKPRCSLGHGPVRSLARHLPPNLVLPVPLSSPRAIPTPTVTLVRAPLELVLPV